MSKEVERGNVTFSCDLVANVKQHLLFLQKSHQYMTSFQSDDPSYLLESLRRYQDLWLPWVASNQKSMRVSSNMIPPPDIAWLWHCHRLAPRQYCAYCVQTFGFIVEAKPPFTLVFPNDSTDRSVTEVLWTERYPKESFFIQHTTDCVKGDFPLIGSVDLLESTKRQANFLWQVSGERFSDDDFLQQGVTNYAKFLKLTPKAMQQQITLVPTYQIDLMWHTHMLTSMQQYNDDCLRIMNFQMYHDDSLTDRSDGGLLDVSYRATEEMWQKEYGMNYAVDGGMYRGEPPKEYYSPAWGSPSNGNRPFNHHLIGKVGASSTPPPSDDNRPFNHHLIGKVGASSTSPPLARWAPLTSRASDGQPAFIPTHEQTYIDVRELGYKENYVLGRIHFKTGYYHMETKEAHKILLSRVRSRIRGTQCFLFCCCCFGSGSKLKQNEEQLHSLRKAKAELEERLRAPVPSGGTQRKMDDQTIFLHAGGACGGTIAYTFGGGSGCGGGVDGGDGGGGGCGGCGGGG